MATLVTWRISDLTLYRYSNGEPWFWLMSDGEPDSAYASSGPPGSDYRWLSKAEIESGAYTYPEVMAEPADFYFEPGLAWGEDSSDASTVGKVLFGTDEALIDMLVDAWSDSGLNVSEITTSESDPMNGKGTTLKEQGVVKKTGGTQLTKNPNYTIQAQVQIPGRSGYSLSSYGGGFLGTGATADAVSEPAEDTSSSESEGLSTGAKVGIGLGLVALVGFLATR